MNTNVSSKCFPVCCNVVLDNCANYVNHVISTEDSNQQNTFKPPKVKVPFFMSLVNGMAANLPGPRSRASTVIATLGG